MPSGGAFQSGEEKVSLSQSCTETVAPVERDDGQPESGSRRTGSSSGPASGSGSGDDEEAEEQSVRPCAGAQGQEDVEMNSGLHSRGRTRCHSSSTNRSPGSTTGASSTKSMTSATDSSSYVLHGTRCSQRGHRADCSDPAEQGNHTHRKIMQTVQEMKKRLPTEKITRIKPSTVQALNYALNCVKQVQANSEYYKLLMCNGLEERKDATACTLEQLESITSEHALKNTDTFVVVFSLATGRVVYASEQASSILNCKRKFLDSAKFVELLFHQDVNVFYSHTAQPNLPPWNIGTDSAAVRFECAQVKSFFCRIRGGKDRDGEMRYNPFRFTPYLQKVQGLEGDEEHPCCLALAERIISGYEAPRIPVEKRIFTTTHSPGCVFLEVDDRAVPLLGYLPQDLIGTSVLTCLHPEDCTLMLTMHRKILKFAGQPPFEHSPIRFRCQNGDYITLDTSWSSFVNPWSRKVAFIIGRHKVRTGPLNEDVFVTQNKVEPPVMYEDIKELQSMIYKLFLQPVHTNGSSGYSSLGSNGSHEHYISVASSSDSNGNLWEDSHREPVTLQQICANINKVKSGGQRAYLDSRSKLTAVEKSNAGKQGPGQCVEVQGLRNALEDSQPKQPHIPSYQQINCVDSIIRYLESCSGPALKRKSKNQSVTTSSSSTTSEEEKTTSVLVVETTNVNEATAETDTALKNPISASSAMTVVHTTAAVVGAPLTDITLSTKAMSVVSVTSQCSYSSTIVHVPQPESEVTALEDAPMGSEPTEPAPAPASAPPTPSSSTTTQEEIQVLGLTKEVLSAHTQKEEQEYVDRFRHRILESPFSSYLQQDDGSMAHSVNKADNVMRQSAGERHRSHSSKTRHKRAKPQGSLDSNASPPASFLPGASQAPNNSSSESSQPKHNFFSPIMPVQPPYYPMPPQPGTGQPQGLPMMLQQEPMQPVMQVMNPFLPPVMAFIMPYPSPYNVYPQGVPGITGVQGVTPAGLAPFPVPRPLMDTPPYATPSAVPPAPDALLTSPISSPWPDEDVDTAQPTALFSSSRSSSPLQLNLLQEELPKPIGPQSSTGRAESLHEKHTKEDDAPSDSGNQDAQSTSSGLLDLLLHEDARSGTGSNASGSGSGESGGSLGSGSGLGSNGTTTSHTGSSNSSKYFASNDSSDTSRKGRKNQETPASAPFKCVEDSLWTMIQHTPEPVMMTYQIHPRDQSQVLKEDREKLLVLQPMQPWFTQEQKEELAEVHSWIHQSNLPEEINTQGCVSCNLTALEEGDGSVHSPELPTPSSSSPLDCTPDDISPITDT